jgi:hypothetical protein
LKVKEEKIKFERRSKSEEERRERGREMAGMQMFF